MTSQPRDNDTKESSNTGGASGSSSERQESKRYRAEGTGKRRGAREGANSEPRDRSHPLFRLQRHSGNQAVKRLLKRGIQPKRQVGQPDDTYEREADRAAEAVVRMPDPNTEPRREETALAARSSGGDSVTTGPGRPLPGSVRSFLEPRFGYDLGAVRVHATARNDELAASLGATAFTVGQDVVFRSDAYRPGTMEGMKLLAHEVTHVLQQRRETKAASTHAPRLVYSARSNSRHPRGGCDCPPQGARTRRLHSWLSNSGATSHFGAHSGAA